ncbi:MAG: hypothetical protein LBN35_02490 [Clostridiales Family XIII bacterium]|nr:hypothetical protein [Clostridiales Family XIII bacterium]
MALFGTVVWIAGGMLGYYWNGFQARISGISISWQQTPTGAQGFNGSTAFYLMLVIPVVAVAIIASQGRRGLHAKLPFQVLLLITLIAYLFSAIYEVQLLKPIGRDLFDINVALDYAVYVPFAVSGFITAFYMLLVVLLPASLGTRIVGIFTVLISGVCYIVYAGFIIYDHMMYMLGGSFTTTQFGIYLVCFGCDAVTFYFMLSVLMTFCAIRREDRIPLKKTSLSGMPKYVNVDDDGGGVAPLPGKHVTVVGAVAPEPGNPVRLSGGRPGADSAEIGASSNGLGC